MIKKDIKKDLKKLKIKKIIATILTFVSIALIITGIVLYRNSLAFRIILYASIAILLISIIATLFYKFSLGDLNNMYKVYSLIVDDNILLIDELSNIFGMGNTYVITIINNLISHGYLKNYTFKNPKELKHYEEIIMKKES